MARGATAAAPAPALRGVLRDLRIELAIHTRRVAGRVGLHDTDLAVLDVLTREGSQTPTALARRCGVHPATLTGVLARLARDGWIERSVDHADRRSARIEPAAVSRLTEVFAEGNTQLAAVADALPEGHAQIVLAYLSAVTEVVRKNAQELKTVGH